jgi:hypothetical protein
MSQNIDPVQDAVKNIDLSKVTADEIFKDVIEQSRQFAFRVAIASTLLDIIQRPPAPAPAPAAAPDVVDPDSNEHPLESSLEGSVPEFLESPVDVSIPKFADVPPEDLHPAHVPPPAPIFDGGDVVVS